MKKTPITHASHNVSKAIFQLAVLLVLVVAVFSGLNILTQGAVVDFLSRFDKTTIETVSESHDINIAVAAQFTSFSPLNFEFQNRLVLNNTFEGLISLDASLRPKQALAVTFGQVSDLVWEFRLREGVQFHNGSLMSASDVVKSFKAAMGDETSQLKSITANIDNIEASDGNIVITTKVPDPTFLNKLATVYVFKDFGNGEIYGTGPYNMIESNTDEVIFEKFKFYWGNQPEFDAAKFTYMSSRVERLRMFMEDEIDIYRNVPFNQIKELTDSGVTVISQPSLEVTFLGFGFKSSTLFRDPMVAEVLREAIDTENLSKKLGGSVKPAKQFVSNGVIGYSSTKALSDITSIEKTDVLNEIKKEVARRKDGLKLSFSKGLLSIATQIQRDLQGIGVEVALDPLTDAELLTLLTEGRADMYILGWKSEFGDAIDMYKSLVHSRVGDLGVFNAGSYSNPIVDELILESGTMFTQFERVKVLQKIMDVIMFEQPFGLPLLETQIMYAISDDISFIPRIDGYVNLNEIK